MKIFRPISTLAISVIILTSTTALADQTLNTAMPTPTINGIAVLSPTHDNSVSGIVKFIPVNGGVKVVADLSGLSPGSHGFHIHEYGDCSAPDGMSAGGHFNPTGMKHASPAANERHGGDLGNLVADTAGKAHYEFTNNMLALDGPNSILGRSVVVHANADDLKSQPAGNSGPRTACGVIGIGK